VVDKILCWFFGHQLEEVRKLYIGGSLYECRLCEKKLCVHHGRQMVIDYTPDIEKFEKEIKDMLEKFK
jgi:hypothetical protein